MIACHVAVSIRSAVSALGAVGPSKVVLTDTAAIRIAPTAPVAGVI